MDVVKGSQCPSASVIRERNFYCAVRRDLIAQVATISFAETYVTSSLLGFSQRPARIAGVRSAKILDGIRREFFVTLPFGRQCEARLPKHSGQM